MKKNTALKITTSLLPLPLTILLIFLIGNYQSYYDMGINQGANSIVLIFLFFPCILILLFLFSFIVKYILHHFLKDERSVQLYLIVLLLTMSILIFSYFVYNSWDYPTEKEKSIFEFFQHFFLIKD